jgi:hypothetical protein
MYKLEFTLKQHTPIIHFQHDQAGATLRATEVKPKLDRFILAQLGSRDTNKGLEIARNKSLLLADGSHPSLNFKIKIDNLGPIIKYFITSNPNSINDEQRRENIRIELDADYINQTQYFGNNKNLERNVIINKEDVKLGILSKGVKLTITTQKKELFDYLTKNQNEILRAFFVSNSFGTRQSKGFGCFLPEKISESDCKRFLNYEPDFLAVFKKKETKSFIVKLQTIATDYGSLKRGTSYRTYSKSELWKYLCNSQHIRWEKRKIKTNISSSNPELFKSLKSNIPHRIDDCPDADETYQYFYIRALLGLAEQFEFVKNDNSRLRIKVKDNSPDNYKIERFQSPLRYFVTEDSIFLVAMKINSNLQEYCDDSGVKHTRFFLFETPGAPSFTLSIPKVFDIVDFLNKHAGYIKI